MVSQNKIRFLKVQNKHFKDPYFKPEINVSSKINCDLKLTHLLLKSGFYFETPYIYIYSLEEAYHAKSYIQTLLLVNTKLIQTAV